MLINITAKYLSGILDRAASEEGWPRAMPTGDAFELDLQLAQVDQGASTTNRLMTLRPPERRECH